MNSTEQLGSVLQKELEKAKTNLKGVDETLQRFLGRDPAEPRPIRRRISAPATRPSEDFTGRPYGEGRGEFGNRPYPDGHRTFLGKPHPEDHRIVGSRPHPEGRGDYGGRFMDVHSRRRDRCDEDPRGDVTAPAAKRRITQGDNGSLGVVVIGPRLRRASVSDDEHEPRPSVPSHVIPGPGGAMAGARDELEPADEDRSRQTALQERKADKENVNRSRRMFGALLGTLQRFRRDEVKQKDKVEKRAEIERRLEDAARREKAQLRQQKAEMFATRKRKQQEVRLIELKMARVKEEEAWEAHQKRLMNFVRTRGKPHIFFMPKLAHPNSDALLVRTQKELAESIEARRRKLQDDLALFDARLQRLQDPSTAHDGGDHSGNDQEEDEDDEEEMAPGGVVSSVVVTRGAGGGDARELRPEDVQAQTRHEEHRRHRRGEPEERHRRQERARGQGEGDEEGHPRTEDAIPRREGSLRRREDEEVQGEKEEEKEAEDGERRRPSTESPLANATDKLAATEEDSSEAATRAESSPREEAAAPQPAAEQAEAASADAGDNPAPSQQREVDGQSGTSDPSPLKDVAPAEKASCAALDGDKATLAKEKKRSALGDGKRDARKASREAGGKSDGQDSRSWRRSSEPHCSPRPRRSRSASNSSTDSSSSSNGGSGGGDGGSDGSGSDSE